MKEPWIRVVKKAELGKRETLILRLEAIVLALVAGGFFILLIGQNPFVIYQTIVTGALRSEMAIQATVKIMIPLLIASLGVTLAFKMKFWNIGAEGQIIMGGIFASYFALFHANWNHWLLVIVMFLAGAIGGGLWGLIPAWFKTRYDTNETLFTLMLNYIALNVIVFLREGAWRDPGSQGYAKIARFNKNAALDKVFGIQFGWVIALILVVVIAVYLNRSKQGYEISVVGESENTAKYVGIKVEKVIIRTMLLSGALCGLVGLLLVGGINHTVTTTIAGGQGFTAVLVSWMSKFNPLTMVFSSFLIIFMDRGASEISTNFGLNHSYSDILTGIILFFIIGCEFFITYRLQFRKKAEKEEQ